MVWWDTMNQYHATKNCSRPLFGRKIEPGELIEPGDMYDSTAGDWAPCPCPGLVLQEGTSAYWVRPIKEEK